MFYEHRFDLLVEAVEAITLGACSTFGKADEGKNVLLPVSGVDSLDYLYERLIFRVLALVILPSCTPKKGNNVVET